MLELRCEVPLDGGSMEAIAFQIATVLREAAGGDFGCVVSINGTPHRIFGDTPLEALGNAVAFLRSYVEGLTSRPAAVRWL